MLDAAAAVQEISHALREQLAGRLRRRGLVVAMSGGIDSSVSAALAVQAVGPRRVFGLFLPEHESDPRSRDLAAELAAQLGIESATENIAPILEACGCYRRRNAAIRRVIPEFRDDWGCKLVLPGDRLSADRINVSSIVVEPPGGAQMRVRLPAAEYREIVAASNFKQRIRTMMAYFHADRLHYAVVGTPNRLEYDQGFFVRLGDGAADLKPIAHLYKTQVYALGAALRLPASILQRAPTTDTYPLPQGQDEFFFTLPYAQLDLCLWALDHQVPAGEVAAHLHLAPELVQRVFADLAHKRTVNAPLHWPALLVEPQ